MCETKFIDHDFKLPNYSTEIIKAEDAVVVLKERVKKMLEVPYVTDKIFVKLYEDIVRVLDYVGKLSVPCFNVQDEMEKLYFLQYPHSPHLAKKLWQEHYEDIHKPYTLLKNRCFRMLDEIDKYYIKCNKKNPPNWKY
jgi:hypothetical protein